MQDGATNADIQTLVGKLSHPDGKVREGSREALVEMGEVAVLHLIHGLASKDTVVRWECAQALKEIGSPTSAAALIAALEDREFDVQWLAAEGLIVLGWAAVPSLLRALETRAASRSLRQGAHHVLRHFISQDAAVEHHLGSHPALPDSNQLESLKPVVEAIEGAAPAEEVPVAARNALLALGLQGG